MPQNTASSYNRKHIAPCLNFVFRLICLGFWLKRSLCMLQVIQSQPVSETCDTWSYGVVSRTLATTYTRKKTEKANLKCWEVYFVTKGSGMLCCDNILQLRQVIEEKSWQCEYTLWLHKKNKIDFDNTHKKYFLHYWKQRLSKQKITFNLNLTCFKCFDSIKEDNFLLLQKLWLLQVCCLF